MKLELRVEESFNLFAQSFNRVKYFSCIADNLNAENLPKAWVIQNPSGLSYKLDVPSKDKEEYLIDGYKHFMQRYLVRDCIESFALCLDNLFFMLLLHGKQAQSNQPLYNCLSEEEKNILKMFQNTGISSRDGKVQILKQRFKLELPKAHNKVISGLKDIRNCLSHNNGIVRNTDGKKDGNNKRQFHWTIFTVFAVGTKSGKRFEIKFDQPFEEEVNICGKIDLGNKSKSFTIGKSLFFNSVETYEIAWSLQLVAQEYLKIISESLHSSSQP